QLDLPEPDGQPTQGEDAQDHEPPHRDVERGTSHAMSPFSSGSVVIGLDLAPDEALDDGIGRALDGPGLASLDDDALVEHGHAVGDLEDLGDLVADHHRGEAALAVQLLDEAVDGVDEDRIEAGGGLVEEDDLRLRDQGAGDGHALAHAARDLRRVLVPHVHQADLQELLLHAAGDVRRGHRRLLAQGERHVVEHGHGVEEGAPLEDHSVAAPHHLEGGAPEASDVRAVHENGARVRAQETQEMFEEHRLAAAAAADDDHDLARGHLETDAPEHRLAAEGLAQTLNADHGRTEPRK